jgi:hypothetical protein
MRNKIFEYENQTACYCFQFLWLHLLIYKSDFWLGGWRFKFEGEPVISSPYFIFYFMPR